jgi:hypothetical protein
VLQFNVTNEPDVGKELKNSFLYDFATMKEVDMTETVESAKQGFKVRNGELLASTVASIRDTKEHIKAERKGVEKIATAVIERCYRYYRTRRRMYFVAVFLPIRRNCLIRRLQLAVRRRWLRLKLLAWEALRVRRIYWRRWWQELVDSEGYALTLRKVKARSLVRDADGGRHDVRLGTLGIEARDAELLADMSLKLRQMRGIASGAHF